MIVVVVVFFIALGTVMRMEMYD